MAQEYIVKKGDTLWGIARHFGKTVSQLAEWNGLSGRQVHDLNIGQHIVLKSENDLSKPDLILSIYLLDLVFHPIQKATLRLEYDGHTHILNTTTGSFSNIRIDDHAKGLKVYFRNFKDEFDLIADHRTLPYGGEKTLTLTSRMVKATGSYAPQQGVQQKSISTIQRELKKQNRQILSPSASSTASTPSAKQKSTLPSEPSKAEIKSINQTMRTDNGDHTHVVAVQFTEDNLLLSDGNLPFRPYIIAAAKAHGLAPQALAALINAEAAKLGKVPNQYWNAKSKNHKTSAGGLTQFLDGAWLEICENDKSLVCQYLKAHPKTSKSARLALKFNAEYAIDAAAVYAEGNIAQLGKKPYNLPIDKITDPTEKAKLAYLAHHEGAKGAYRIIMGLDDNDVAKNRLHKQIPDTADQYIARFVGADSAKTAYAVWLCSYVDNHIRLENFTIESSRNEATAFPPEATLDSVIVALGGKSYAAKIPAPKTPSIDKPQVQTKSNSDKVKAQPQTTIGVTQSQSTMKPAVTSTENSASVGGDGCFVGPLVSCTIRTALLANITSATFGMVRNHGHRAHQGVDLAATSGTDILAVASGAIVAINPAYTDYGSASFGAYVVLKIRIDDLPSDKAAYAKKHARGDYIWFFYAHLSAINVQQDQLPLIVNAGDILGKTGHSGNAHNMITIQNGAHLHFEVWSEPNHGNKGGLGGRFNPLPFLKDCITNFNDLPPTTANVE